MSHYFVRYHSKPTYEDLTKQEIVNLIPARAPAIATFDFLPKLSQRKDIYTFYMLWKLGPKYGKNPIVEYAAIDFNDFFVEKAFTFMPKGVSDIFAGYTDNKNWEAVLSKGDIVLFKKSPAPERKIVELLDINNFPDKKEPALTLDDSLELLDFTALAKPENNIMHLTFYWRVKNTSASLYKILFFASDKKTDKAFCEHSIGYKFFTPALKENEVLKEDYYLILPASAEKFTFSFTFINITEQRLAKIDASGELSLDKHGKIVMNSGG